MPAAPARARLSPDLLRCDGAILLDAARPDPDTGHTGAFFFSAPHTVLTAHTVDEVLDLLDALDAEIAKDHYVAGYLAYEAAYAFEPGLFAEPPAGTLAWFGVYDPPEQVPSEEVEGALEAAGPVSMEAPRLTLNEGAHAACVDRIRALIRDGDVYQINLTAPFRFAVEGDPLALYGHLRRRQRVAYSAYLCAVGRHVLSLSPELFFRLDGRRITARPMKGTVRRGATPEEDDRLAAGLAADEKGRAENLMIVDLLRNDLARVSVPGSVRVPRLFETERYETLIQMTSTVEADLRPGTTVGAVVRALFPCGSVTGAPKLRAMQRIRELETAPRGVYCGAIGYAGPDGAVFNVPIRTLVLESEGNDRFAGTFGVGGGIVWDSSPAEEYAECLLKARFLTG
ncbi:MAG TPA: aminodeoxychorismate synthase component I [Rubricoccaceae bacterium]|nr:aminodeoxychorismate synthase component I [Rubricoccaceae bacterium]